MRTTLDLYHVISKVVSRSLRETFTDYSCGNPMFLVGPMENRKVDPAEVHEAEWVQEMLDVLADGVVESLKEVFPEMKDEPRITCKTF